MRQGVDDANSKLRVSRQGQISGGHHSGGNGSPKSLRTAGLRGEGNQDQRRISNPVLRDSFRSPIKTSAKKMARNE